MAMLIFAIVSTGLIFTMLSVLSLAPGLPRSPGRGQPRGGGHRPARAKAELFELHDKATTRDLNGDTFHVDRETSSGSPTPTSSSSAAPAAAPCATSA